jgi:competence protein ComEA
MDETGAPWRALEQIPGGGSGSAPAAAPEARPPALSARQLASAIASGLAGIVGLGAFWLVAGAEHGSVVVDGDRPAAIASGRPVAVASGAGAAAADRLVVDVQGAVVRPGIVQLPAGSRVGDAIAAAGGFAPRVATDRVARSLNLAALVHDGDQILVPSRDDPATSTGGGVAASGAPPGGSGGGGELVDLNHASAEALDALPGVGPATAAKIIAAREEQPFASIEDLRTRKVVGDATFAKLKALVTVR